MPVQLRRPSHVFERAPALDATASTDRNAAASADPHRAFARPAHTARVPSYSGSSTLPREATSPPEVTDLPVLLTTRVSVAVVSGVLAVQLLVPGGWGQSAPILLAAGLLAGLPHGAVDHLVPGWVGPNLGAKRLAALLSAYAAAALVAFVLLRAAPLPGVVIFVLLSGLHFGTGEVQLAALRAGRLVKHRWAAVAAYGGVTAVLPLVQWPQQVAPVLSALVPGSTGILPGPLRRTALVGIVGLVAVTLLRQMRDRRLGEGAELMLLTTMFLLVPPLAAFGAYFGGWHSIRHLARMLSLNPANAADLAAGRLRGPLVRFTRAALAPTLASLLVLGALWTSASGWQAFAASDLALLAGLTVPHVLTVSWLDRRLRSMP